MMRLWHCPDFLTADVAVFFQFQNSGAYTVQTILATNGQPFQAVIPIVRQERTYGTAVPWLSGQPLILQVVSCS